MKSLLVKCKKEDRGRKVARDRAHEVNKMEKKKKEVKDNRLCLGRYGGRREEEERCNRAVRVWRRTIKQG